MKAKNVRSVDGKPYTRKEYIHKVPRSEIRKFEMGEDSSKYDAKITLHVNEKVKIRDNALEAVRVSVNRNLQKSLRNEYCLRIKTYPHHILRENKLIFGAGADRMQEGMRKAFGKSTGRAAIVEEDQPILTVKTFEQNVDDVERALHVAKSKIPKGAHIEVKSINVG